MTYPTKPTLFFDCADCGETNFIDLPYAVAEDGSKRLVLAQMECACGWKEQA